MTDAGSEVTDVTDLTNQNLAGDESGKLGKRRKFETAIESIAEETKAGSVREGYLCRCLDKALEEFLGTLCKRDLQTVFLVWNVVENVERSRDLDGHCN